MKTVTLPSGEQVPCLGQGTWYMGDDGATRDEELATLRLGLDAGLTLIDTAEMYGSGRAESLVAEAIAGRREEVFLVSKVLPGNASRRGTVAACEASLKRLRTDRIDLYLLHWRGEVPFAETIDAFAALKAAGKIRYYGVSNLDRADMEELWQLPGAKHVAANQLLYNLTRRGLEWNLLPWLRQHRIPVMAYSPLEQGRLAKHPKLVQFAKRAEITPAQAALAWLLAKDDVIAIPKCAGRERLRENVDALEFPLAPEQLEELDALFPPPQGPSALEMI